MLFLGDKYPKHHHIGTTVFGNFVKEKASSTDYSVKMTDSIRELLKGKNYEFFEIDGSMLEEKVQDNPYSAFSSEPKEPLKALLLEHGEKHKLDYMFILRPVVGEASGSSTVYISGFGLYTHCQLWKCVSEALNNHDLDIIEYPSLENVDLWNWRHFRRRTVPNIPFGDAVKNLDESEINRATDIFLDEFEALTKEKLIWGRFIEEQGVMAE